MDSKILIAISGGVDSSVTAFLLKRESYDCHATIMRLFSPSTPDFPILRDAFESDERDAAQIAKLLGIPFSVCDCSEEFRREVMDDFVRTYLEGCTPNPCIVCNRTMKFGRLFREAEKLGCTALATGHYARIGHTADGAPLLMRAKDSAKDQSYVLWQLKREQLARIRFPLGDLTKDEVRAIAEENGFCNARRSDSQDICFIPNGDYVSFIERYTNQSFPQGSFIDENGNVLGTHNGSIRYTVGQRKGLGISFGKPAYVIDKDAQKNTVTIGSSESLFKRTLTAHSINLTAVDTISSPLRVEAKIRYGAKPALATAEQTSEGTFTLVFDEAQRAITPGQSVVLYDGDTVIGGGIID